MMMPPPPPGFEIQGAAPRRDPWDILKAEGFVASNGYRTDGDTARIRAQGYKPAPNSDHTRGDGVDLDHPKLSPRKQEQRLHELFGDWEGRKILDEGHHRHLSLPGWGAAPGTPGTPNAGMPDLPPGFDLEQRGSLAGGNFNAKPSDETLAAMQVATIRQNGFNPQDQARNTAKVLGDLYAPQPAPVEGLPRIGIGPGIQAATAAITGKESPFAVAPTIGGFADELPPEVLNKLSPEKLVAFYQLLGNDKSTAKQLGDFMAAEGFDVNADALVEARSRGKKISDTPTYQPLSVDQQGGATGSLIRGVSDPFNFLDEGAGVVDSLTGANGRESIWNSDRTLKDILYGNIDKNRAIIGADEREHPYARLSGQLLSSVAMPYGGGIRSASALGKLGAAEGFTAGIGSGEGGLVDRLPGGVVGAGFGYAGGYALGRISDGVGTAWAARKGAQAGDTIRDGGYEAAPIVEDGIQNAGPTPAARYQPLDGRQRDYIDVGNLPPLPDGFALDPAMGRARPMGERATPEQMAGLASRIQPGDVTPVPYNRVETLDEAMRANPGSVRNVEAPDEMAALDLRRFPSSGTRPVTQRGPVDLVGFLRSQGGIRDEGGELSHLGIDNVRRDADFANREQFLGRLVNPDGQSLDNAAHRAWEAGYFPDHAERPTIDEFLDAVEGTHSGFNRRFLPGDMAEVSRFEGMRDQRNMVEQAGADGIRLGEQVGEPVGLDDLTRNQAPVTAYEDLPTLGGRAGNIALDKLETRGDIRRALTNTEAMFGGFDAARRGKISHEETAALADDLGMRADDLLARRQGQALNAEQALAARRILAKSGDELVALASKAKGGSDADLAAFQRAMVRHAAIQEQVTGATAEAGRALSQFKVAARSKDHHEAIMRALIDGAGGRDSLEETAARIIELQKVPGALNKFALDAVKPTWRDKAVELYYNSLLSSPATHAVNILSNALTSALQLPEQMTAVALGAFRAGSVDRVMASEIGPRAVGLMQGAMEGLRAARLTFKTGKVPDHVSKVEAAMQEAIPGKLGHVLRTPTRALSAEDEFFKAIARRSELAALAVRKANAEGLRGEAKIKRIAELNANPDAAMMERALDYARYLTFQRPVGPVAGAVLQATRSMPWLKLIAPFVRTPTNILKFATERSPLAPLLKEVRADFKAGGAKRDVAIARMTLGSGLGLVVTELARDGKITGKGPADDNARKALMADGWQPYSIKIGDRYYSYQRLDPLATTLGVAADYVDLQSAMTDAQREKIGSLVAASIVSNLSDKTWLSGLSDAVSAIHDPMRFGPQFVNRMVGSVTVPAGMGQLARTLDETPREAKTPLETIRSRIPGLSQGLRPRLDGWGRPVIKEGGAGPDIMSPVYVSTRRMEPINKEALRLNLKLSDPARTLADGNRLENDEFHAYKMEAGKLLLEKFEPLIASPQWQAMSRGAQVRKFETLRKEARRSARAVLGFGGSDFAGRKAGDLEPARREQPSSQSSAPPLPPGFEYEERQPAARGQAIPPLPAGFELE